MNGLRGITITGTDTDVGKTVLTASIAAQLRSQSVATGIYKPVCSGSELVDGINRWLDVETHFEVLGGVISRARIAPQCFAAALAPPVAAGYEGREVSIEEIHAGFDWWSTRCEVLLVEGAGGLHCPITSQQTFADCAASFGFPLLIVARASLGTVNHTLLTVEVAVRRKIPIAGIVLNMSTARDEPGMAQQNAHLIRQHTDVPVLGIHPFNGTGRLLVGNRMQTLDWETIAGRRNQHENQRERS